MATHHICTRRSTPQTSDTAVNALTAWVIHKKEAQSSSNLGLFAAATADSSIPTRSSTVKRSRVSKFTGGSTIRSRRVRRSSSADTGWQDLSNKGRCVIIRNLCSKRVCSAAFQCPHRFPSHRPAMLMSSLHSKHRAYTSTTRLCRRKPKKRLTTDDTKYAGFNVLIFRFRTEKPQTIHWLTDKLRVVTTKPNSVSPLLKPKKHSILVCITCLALEILYP